jgi:hypothetical protein
MWKFCESKRRNRCVIMSVNMYVNIRTNMGGNCIKFVKTIGENIWKYYVENVELDVQSRIMCEQICGKDVYYHVFKYVCKHVCKDNV